MLVESEMDAKENLPSLRVFVVCDQSATAPIWGYLIREKGLTAILETSIPRALQRYQEEIPDLIVIDVSVPHEQRIEICRHFRAQSSSPILLFVPSNNEQEILDAYQAGVDECVIKPISPAIFLAKITAWARRSWTIPVTERETRRLHLDPSRRCIILPEGDEIRLTNTEFRLLHLLMSRPGYVFSNEEIIQTVWGTSGTEPAVLKNAIYRLRRKLEAKGLAADTIIRTWSKGYSFQEE